MKSIRQTIIDLYESGMPIVQITKELKTYPSLVNKVVKNHLNTKNPNIFNVYELDCWIMPTTE